MDIISFIIICLFLEFDITLLKRRALALFESVFYVSLRQMILSYALLGLAVISLRQSGLIMVQIVFIILLTIYFLRRVRFLKTVKSSPEHAALQDENLELALLVVPVICWWACGMIAISLLSEMLERIFQRPFDPLAGLLIFSEISSVLFVALIYRAVRRFKGLKLFEIFSLQTKGLGWMKVWGLPSVFALCYAGLTSWILNARPIQPLTPLQDILNSTSSLGALLFFAGTAILTAPFFEEIIFRGFFFSVIARFKGSVFAVIFVALVFGGLHVEQYWGDWGVIAVVGFFGLALTVFRALSGSSVPGMVAHYVYNTSLIVIPVAVVLFSNPIYLDYQINYYRLTDAQKETRLLESIDKYPQFSNSYNDLAWLYSEKGVKLDSALTLIDKALVIEPDNYAFLDTKAEVLYKMGRAHEASVIEQDLMKKYPNDTYLRQQLKKFDAPKTSVCPEPQLNKKFH